MNLKGKEKIIAFVITILLTILAGTLGYNSDAVKQSICETSAQGAQAGE